MAKFLILFIIPSRYLEDDEAAEAVEIVKSHEGKIRSELANVPKAELQKTFRQIINPLLNRPTKQEKSSQFRGVAWSVQSKRWNSYIYLSGNQYSLGLFTDESKASQAYESAWAVRKDWERELELAKEDTERIAKFRTLRKQLLGDLPDNRRRPRQNSRDQSQTLPQYTCMALVGGKKWHARLGIGGIKHEIGLYDDPETARKDMTIISGHVAYLTQQSRGYADHYEMMKFVKSYIATTLGKEVKLPRKLTSRRRKSELSLSSHAISRTTDDTAATPTLATSATVATASLSTPVLPAAPTTSSTTATATTVNGNSVVRHVPSYSILTEGIHWSAASQQFKVTLDIDDAIYFIAAFVHRGDAEKTLDLFQSQKLLLRAQLRRRITDHDKRRSFRSLADSLLDEPTNESEETVTDTDTDYVRFCALSDEWVAVIRVAGSYYEVGRYSCDKRQTAQDELAVTLSHRDNLEAELATVSNPAHKSLLFNAIMTDLFDRKYVSASSASLATVEWLPEYRQWRSRIHIEGRYAIGRYALEDEATAVAHYRAVAASRDELCDRLRSVEGVAAKHRVFNKAVTALLGCKVPVEMPKAGRVARRCDRHQKRGSAGKKRVRDDAHVYTEESDESEAAAHRVVLAGTLEYGERAKGCITTGNNNISVDVVAYTV